MSLLERELKRIETSSLEQLDATIKTQKGMLRMSQICVGLNAMLIVTSLAAQDALTGIFGITLSVFMWSRFEYHFTIIQKALLAAEKLREVRETYKK
jgi:hypothetical protein